MNFDFEESLRRQSIRPIPGEWREEILRAARDGRDAARRRPVGAARLPCFWWREWLWPCPRAWAGLAAAWGIILLLNVTAPEEPPVVGQLASASWQDLAFLRQETEMIAQLAGSEENRPAPPPQPAALKPRGCRRVKPSVG
jgi:hypothetical protein